MNNAIFLPINLPILLVSYPSVIHELPACVLRAIPPGGLAWREKDSNIQFRQ